MNYNFNNSLLDFPNISKKMNVNNLKKLNQNQNELNHSQNSNDIKIYSQLSENEPRLKFEKEVQYKFEKEVTTQSMFPASSNRISMAEKNGSEFYIKMLKNVEHAVNVITEDIKSTKNFQIEKKLYASTPNNKTVNIKYDSCQNELKEEENKVVSNKRK
jgi:hypothetical protein